MYVAFLFREGTEIRSSTRPLPVRERTIDTERILGATYGTRLMGYAYGETEEIAQRNLQRVLEQNAIFGGGADI